MNSSNPMNMMNLNINSTCSNVNYSEEGLKSCIKCLYTLNTSIQSSQLKAITRKYRRGRYFEVARLASKYVQSNSGAGSGNHAATGGSNASAQ